MPRIKVFKKRKNVFHGTHNPGGKIINNINNSEPIASSTQVGLGLGHNQTPSDNISTKESSSKKKLTASLGKYDDYTGDISDRPNDIINLGHLESMLCDIAVCVKCGGSLSLNTSNRQGLQVKLHMKCNSCNFEISSYNSKKLPTGKSEINVRTAYAFRSIGKGEQAAKIVCGIMNLPKPAAFKYYTNVLLKAAKEVSKYSMERAVTQAVKDNDDEHDLTAIFDGSWQRRGHSSLNGIVSAIGGDACKVLDIKIFSKHCRCKERVQGNHDASCVANYQGSSGGMEVKGVLEMFRESEAKYNVRYKYYLGDGDSVSYSTVSNEKPYGPDYDIEKKECIGHIQKRMGCRLRSLKKKMGKTLLADGKTIGGKGRLTFSTINTMQLYYGLGIRRNVTSLEGMKTAVWAQYFHMGSTNENPEHGLCPNGQDSWCKYKKALESGESYDHNQHTHVNPIVMKEMKPIFRDLANPSLLAKCLHGKTQNPSESLNNVIWSRLPKSTFIMKSVLELGVYDAVACYNDGNIAKCEILSRLGIVPGSNCVAALKREDLCRIAKAETAIDEIEKKCRRKATAAKRKLEDIYEDEEGAEQPAYGAGMF